MKIIRDIAKSAANLRKHKLDFTLAQRVFDDPHQLSEQDRVEGNEYRWQTLGSIGTVIVTVGHTYEIKDGEEIIRLITARIASPGERRRYHEGTHH